MQARYVLEPHWVWLVRIASILFKNPYPQAMGSCLLQHLAPQLGCKGLGVHASAVLVATQ
jgi:hypothetical protein